MDKRKLYECIMRNIAIQIKKTLNEANDKKSKEQIKAESKLSQDEKVDLWISGERDINLKACSPDKLRKYYKIAKAKDFVKGVLQIEKIAKEKNIKLDKEIKESMSKNDTIYEEWKHIETSMLFVGDICYALDDDVYDQVWLNQCDAKDGLVTDGSTIYAVVGATAHGDGTYYDDLHNEFGVDAGNIGVTDLDYMDKSNNNYEKAINDLKILGVVVEVPSGLAAVDFYVCNGVFYIKIVDEKTSKVLYDASIDTVEDKYDEDIY